VAEPFEFRPDRLALVAECRRFRTQHNGIAQPLGYGINKPPDLAVDFAQSPFWVRAFPFCLGGKPLPVEAFHARPRGGRTPSQLRSRALSRGERPAAYSSKIRRTIARVWERLSIMARSHRTNWKLSAQSRAYFGETHVHGAG